MSIKEELNKIFETLNKFNIGDLPSNELEQDIFSEMDLLESYLFSKKKDILEGVGTFDMNVIKRYLTNIEQLIKKMGFTNFQKNKTLMERYNLSKKAIELIEQIMRE